VTESLGTRLRRERERRRISIKSIAETTNIRAALFEQLERDDASRWPSGIFRRSFIRAYASAIGLDPESTVREFLAAFPDPAQPPDKDKTVAKATSEMPAARPPELRLRLAAGHVAPRHWQAAFCDAVVLAAMALASAILFRQVWMPLGICMCAYYAAGTVMTGASPGIFFLAWYRRLGQTTAKAAPAPTRSPAPFLIHPDRGHGLSLELSAESGAVSNQ
jgi:transcriptional regulator with XRE-family HTH domain